MLAKITGCLPTYVAKGAAMAAFYLARCLQLGRGTQQDQAAAEKYYSKVSWGSLYLMKLSDTSDLNIWIYCLVKDSNIIYVKKRNLCKKTKSDKIILKTSKNSLERIPSAHLLNQTMHSAKQTKKSVIIMTAQLGNLQDKLAELF